jgi:elongator complex protein 3
MRSELRRIAEAVLLGEIASEPELEACKKRASSRLGLSTLPSNTDILGAACTEERERLKMLIRKPTRTLSGVAVISAMTSPARCPHGTCIPCPGGIDGQPASPSCQPSPQSYTGREPAALRAAQHLYRPYSQVSARLRQLYEIGHPLDKAELIVMGGTFSSRSWGYQVWFVKSCLQAMNDFPHPRAENGWVSFHEAALANQTALVRNIGTTFETRPDWCLPEHIRRMLELGATKVELGVQSTRDEILERMGRGHLVADTVDANSRLREAGLKVGFHIMPGLPGSSAELDLAVFEELFESEELRPDYLKIYPTLVIAGTELFRMYMRGEYTPYGDGEAADLISRAKEILPPYLRLQRVQRDIPAQLIVAGPKKSNLRQLAAAKLAERGGRCRCIRCREAGLRGVLERNDLELKDLKYKACGAEEHFLSYESGDDTLVGFLRLRLGEAARVRELHIYGPLVPLGRRGGWQHRGYGAALLRAAEETAAAAGYSAIDVTSGIGARGYYQRLGYNQRGTYMSKKL